MKVNWTGLLGSAVNRHAPKDSDKNAAHKDLQSQVDAAHREWQAAQQYFQMVSEPELVDHAIYTLEAAQRKYRYLIRQLRQAQGQAPAQEGRQWN